MLRLVVCLGLAAYAIAALSDNAKLAKAIVYTHNNNANLFAENGDFHTELLEAVKLGNGGSLTTSLTNKVKNQVKCLRNVNAEEKNFRQQIRGSHNCFANKEKKIDDGVWTGTQKTDWETVMAATIVQLDAIEPPATNPAADWAAHVNSIVDQSCANVQTALTGQGIPLAAIQAQMTTICNNIKAGLTTDPSKLHDAYTDIVACVDAVNALNLPGLSYTYHGLVVIIIEHAVITGEEALDAPIRELALCIASQINTIYQGNPINIDYVAIATAAVQDTTVMGAALTLKTQIDAYVQCNINVMNPLNGFNGPCTAPDYAAAGTVFGNYFQTHVTPAVHPQLESFYWAVHHAVANCILTKGTAVYIAFHNKFAASYYVLEEGVNWMIS